MDNETHPLSSHQQRTLVFYGIYRLMLASSLLVLAGLPEAGSFLSPQSDPSALMLVAIAYALVCILALVIGIYSQLGDRQLLALLLTDLLMLSLILYYWGGVQTGFGNLMIASVAVASLLLPFRLSLLVAAVAASGVVYTEMLIASEPAFVQAALLGAAFFVMALLLHYLLLRVRFSERLAQSQADALVDLRHLNELIVQRISTGVIVADWQGHIKLMNHAASEFLQIATDSTHLPNPLLQSLQHWQQQASDTKVLNHAALQINGARLKALGDSAVVLFVEDTSQFEHKAQQLKLASLGRLTASIAHEIRNPLGAISHATQLLEEGQDYDATDQRLFEIIKHHTQRIDDIINTILNLSRRQRLDLRLWPMTRFVQECVLDYEQGHSQPKHIEQQGSSDVQILIDANLMKQVLHNLMDNGLRYSLQHSGQACLQLHWGVLAKRQQVFLDIKDQGPGIETDQLAHLFEPFYTTEASGTGLGLYIAKELAATNNVQLLYLPKPQGACFRLIFTQPAKEI